MELTPCQSRALEILNQPQNVFVTGEAGTGKSFLIHHYRLKFGPKTPLLASTGAAAVLLGGRTFHSFFGLGILEGGHKKVIDAALKNGKLRKRLRECKELVIDEISMLPGEVLAIAEEICRLHRQVEEPWGGIRIIAVGDFAQLPPVTKKGEAKDWAFLHWVWENTNFQPVVLRTPVRFIDKEFYQVLNTLRGGRVDAAVLELLKKRRAEEVPTDITHLYPWRSMVRDFNQERLDELKTPLESFPSVYAGKEVAIEKLKLQAPIPEVLQLKLDAYVMLRQNDPRGRYANGSTGWVRKIEKDKIHVELLNGRTIKLAKASFSFLDGEGEIQAEVFNYPLSLAYASTIHKSQGQTFDRAVLYLKGLWEPGQAYVALSRLRGPEGLYLSGNAISGYQADPHVVNFYEKIQ